jgi:polyisoprenoid-binding protein YceI
MKPLKFPFGLKVAVLALAFTASASGAWVAQGQKVVSFRAVGPGGLAIVGTASELTLKEQGSNLAVTVGLRGLKTGIELRDKHMKEKYLETQKYPTAVLVVDKSKLTAPSSGAEVNGTLTLHGTTKPVRVHYFATGTAKQVHVEGEFRVNMKEFGIPVPSYLGVTVKPDVHVTAKFDSTDR